MPHAIAIQGFEGCFHQLAAQHYFAPEPVQIAPCATFAEVVQHVAQGRTRRGLLAIENSIAGSILPNYSLLLQAGLQITGEVYLRIRQHLLLLPGQALADIREVHSHPMALRQCRPFLSQFPHWRLVETDDTALSARQLREFRRLDTAAIAGQLAADLFELEVAAADIQSEEHNYTRFLVVEPAYAPQVAVPDKASLYFQAPHQPGSLARVLTVLAGAGLNVSHLQSCPQPAKPWQYGFHADVEFGDPAQLTEALHAARSLTDDLRVLGLYHRGRTY